MLSGIQKGKRKKKAASMEIQQPLSTANDAAAEALKQSLQAGAPLLPATSTTTIAVAAIRKKEDDMTMTELALHERTATLSANEQAARDIFRRGKKRKIKSLHSDDEEELLEQLEQGPRKERHTGKSDEREKARHLAQYDQQQRWIDQSWWWMESSRFAKHRLLAHGQHVALTLAPPALSLGEYHFYLVPVQASSSWAGCDEVAWTELDRFQSSLRTMYKKEHKTVLFYETVLNAKGKQAKMEGVVVPIDHDAPLCFQSALVEQADELGTHQKLMKTKDKGLRRTVPSHLEYFYINWGDNHEGFAQIIETKFPKDFGADVIASMLEVEPLRLRKQQPSLSLVDEKHRILDFLGKYKDYDWTV